MFYKFLVTKLIRFVAKREVRVIGGALLTFGTHKMIQGLVRKYPKLNFLKVVDSQIIEPRLAKSPLAGSGIGDTQMAGTPQ